VTSSLINRATGSRAGARRLSAAVEALIDEAIQSKTERHRLTLAPVDYAAAALAAGDEEGRERPRAALEARPDSGASLINSAPTGLRNADSQSHQTPLRTGSQGAESERFRPSAAWSGPPEVFSRASGTLGTAYFGLRSFSLTKSAPK